MALLGLNLIFARMAWLHNIIMVGGGLYLCWMGYQMLRGALKKETVASAEPQVELARSGRKMCIRDSPRAVAEQTAYPAALS